MVTHDSLPPISHHAAVRAVEMCLSAEEIRELLLHPRNVWPSRKYPGSMVYSNGRIAAAIGDRGYVVTFLWHRYGGDPRFSRELDDELKRIRDADDNG